jgi:hypothetical protein
MLLRSLSNKDDFWRVQVHTSRGSLVSKQENFKLSLRLEKIKNSPGEIKGDVEETQLHSLRNNVHDSGLTCFSSPLKSLKVTFQVFFSQTFFQ